VISRKSHNASEPFQKAFFKTRLLGKKKTTTTTTTQKTQKTQKTPGGVVQRALFVESSSSPKVRFERFFLGVARFLLKRKRQTFEERKISLADSSSSKNKRRRRRKKRRKKKEKNATNTQLVIVALSLSRSLSFSFSLS
jgi:hypothetical protein